MNESLEDRLLSLAKLYKLHENPKEEIRPIYRRLLEFIRQEKYQIDGSTSQSFIKMENEVWKFLDETFKPGRMTKELYKVGDIFISQEKVLATRVNDYIDIYVKSHNLNERVLKNMDSDSFREIRHELYKVLGQIYKK